MDKKEENTTFDHGIYERSMAYGDTHEVATDKGWGNKPEGKSKDTVVIEE